MAEPLPESVRYVKNGRGGKWWPAAKANGQIHAGWENIDGDLLRRADLDEIKKRILSAENGTMDQGAMVRDFNALRTLIDRPSRHVWVTFEDGCLWWCVVSDRLEINPEGESDQRGHFWLSCFLPWSNHSLGEIRRLATSELPGTVAMLGGFRGTVCEPGAGKEILRIIRNEEDSDVSAAREARKPYVEAVGKLVARLGDKDFEALIDLILARDGWARLTKVGGAMEGVDIEVENASAEEIAFVQVKSRASQSVLDDYVARFGKRRDQYTRMIFAVHSPQGSLAPPPDEPIQIWAGEKIADLVVRLGLGEWLAKRF